MDAHSTGNRRDLQAHGTMVKRTGWLAMPEVGGELGIYFLVFTCTIFGRASARMLLPLVALYYLAFHGTARDASRRWLEKIHGQGHVTLRMMHSHLLRFAQVALDRLFFIRHQTWRFDIRIHGDEHLRAIRASGRGVIFLGAHMGSFEAMRVLADADGAIVNILVYFRNARMINSVLQKFDPNMKMRLIDIRPGDVGFMLELKECIERGEHVAILGDRIGLGGESVKADFMGEPAHFPSGVYFLAAMLRCPVYLLLALHSGKNRYDLYCEKFADQIELPRGARREGAAGYSQSFAHRLEYYGRMAPENWFNFFDFWEARP